MADVRALRIGHDHPAIAGHFPGDPLVPGVLILEEVYEAAVAMFGLGRLVEVQSVKFLAPLRPDETFQVRFTPRRNDGCYAFACVRGDCVLARGQLQMADVPPEPA